MYRKKKISKWRKSIVWVKFEHKPLILILQKTEKFKCGLPTGLLDPALVDRNISVSNLMLLKVCIEELGFLE